MSAVPCVCGVSFKYRSNPRVEKKAPTRNVSRYTAKEWAEAFAFPDVSTGWRHRSARRRTLVSSNDGRTITIEY